MTKEITISTSGRVSSTDMIMGDGNLDKIKAFSNLMSGSNMVPQHFQNNTYDCAIVVAKALSMGLDPVAMSGEVFPVKGKMTYGSKLIIAMIHGSNLVAPRTFVKTVGDWDNKGRLNSSTGRFQNEQGLGVKVGFKFVGDEEPTWGSVLMMEDQTNRNSPLWKTDPQQQLTYLAAKRWSSIHTPGVTMGMMSKEEADDYSGDPIPERDITPQKREDFDFGDKAIVNQENQVDIIEEPELLQRAESTAVAAQNLSDDIKAKETPVIETAEVKKPIIAESQPATSATTLNSASDSKEDTDQVECDINGEVFNAEIHTGTKLKDGTWRLNKKGQELKKQREESSTQNIQEPAQDVVTDEGETIKNESSVTVGCYVKAVSDEAIEMLDGEPPFKVISIEEDEGITYVEVEGYEGTNFPMIDEEDTVHLELVDSPINESTTKNTEAVDTKILESVEAIKGQFEVLKQKVTIELDTFEDSQDKTEAIDAIKKWEAVAAKSVSLIEGLGNEVTQDDIDKVIQACKNYQNEKKNIFNNLKERLEDNPF